MDAIVLAGGKMATELYNGKKMYVYTVEAIQKVPYTKKIIIVGGDVSDENDIIHITSENSLIENVKKGIENTSTKKILLASGDIPFINKEAINYFLDKLDEKGMFFYPIIDVKQCIDRFPDMKRTSLLLKEGEFTGGNIFFADRIELIKLMPKIKLLIENRKNLFFLGKMIGWSVLYKVILTKLFKKAYFSINDLENIFNKWSKTAMKAVNCSAYPEIGCDVDTKRQLRAINKSPV